MTLRAVTCVLRGVRLEVRPVAGRAVGVRVAQNAAADVAVGGHLVATRVLVRVTGTERGLRARENARPFVHGASQSLHAYTGKNLVRERTQAR